MLNFEALLWAPKLTDQFPLNKLDSYCCQEASCKMSSHSACYFHRRRIFIFSYISLCKTLTPPPNWPLSRQTNFHLTNLTLLVTRKLHAKYRAILISNYTEEDFFIYFPISAYVKLLPPFTAPRSINQFSLNKFDSPGCQEASCKISSHSAWYFHRKRLFYRFPI